MQLAKKIGAARKKVLQAQMGLRDRIRRRTKQRLFRMLAERERLASEGKRTEWIDREIECFKADMDNESLHSVAKLWLTPLKEVGAAMQIRKLMGKK